jgi:signal transduction histidine kinase
MKLFPRNLKLTDKLSFMLVGVIILMLGIIGVYFDMFLKESYLEDTKKRMLHGYDRLVSSLSAMEKELQDGVSFINSDEGMLASIELINNYQDKTNYSAILLDEEKKLIADELLSRAKLSFNSAMTLYDRNEELIAYVLKEPSGYRLNFITYIGGNAMRFTRMEQEAEYRLEPFSPDSRIPFHHSEYYKKTEPRETPLITYDARDEGIFVKSHLSIFRQGTDDVLAHIELIKMLDKAYFEAFSQDLDMDLGFSTETRLGSHASPLFSDLDPEKMDILQTEETYIGIRHLDTRSGTIYFVLRLNKTALKAALDRNRWQFVFLLLIVAFGALILTRFLFRKWLADPMAHVMTQIDKIEQEDYSLSSTVRTGDELASISTNINRLAQVIQERESSLRQSQSILMETQEALEQLNKNLMEEVAKQIEEIRHKDDIMIQQSKHAAMGEMISNIAHQWRQPLNTLGLNIQDILDAYEFKELDQAYLEEVTSKSMEVIHHMSKTIDDFRNFFAPQKEKKPFSLQKIIGDVRSLVNAQLTNHGIALEISGADATLLGFSNELMQAVINIINNAKDAIDAYRSGAGGKITVVMAEDEDTVSIRICDNGGGIDPEIIQKVFDPYFTTKFKSQGTGIGLYMSKTIVEKNMDGALLVENEGEGACFTIRLPRTVESQ